MSKIILLVGGTGLIGTRLSALLREKNYSVRLLSRQPHGKDQYAWDPAQGKIDEAALADVDAIVNLAGAGIADSRWTDRRKRLIISSRVESAQLLRQALQRSGRLPAVYLSASAIGYYGNSSEKLMRETDLPTDQGFMPECCLAWEQAADKIAALGIRTVKLRIGVVLAKEGGALAEIVRPIRFGIGGYFADGHAWYSWIHRDDVCRAFIWALENQQVEGVFNAVAPHPVRNKDLVSASIKAMRRRAMVVPVPGFALRLVLGEMADVVLNSNRVASEKIQEAGFQFQYPQLEQTLAEIFH